MGWTSAENSRRRKPRFSPKIWSANQSIIASSEFSTNISESFNLREGARAELHNTMTTEDFIDASFAFYKEFSN